MRRSISKIPYRPSISAALSTSSGGGGRGRGAPSHFQFTVDTPPEDESKNSNRDAASPPPHGHGRGRGIPPSFSSFVNNESNPSTFGRGRGIGFVPPNSFSPRREESAIQSPQQPNPKMSFLSKYEEAELDSAGSEAPPAPIKSVPSSIFNVLSGAGRGKPDTPPASQPEKPKPRASEQRRSSNEGTARVQLSEEEKVKKAMGILSKRDVGGGELAPKLELKDGEEGEEVDEEEEAGEEEEGWREEEEEGEDTVEEEAEMIDMGMQKMNLLSFWGDPAAEEKVAKRLGPEVMSKLSEEFEEMSSRVLPSPMDEALLEAYETNIMIECEPEYFMEEFGTSPDIDEKAPIPLRDALEKMKPFLMAYEGIQSQEEWEEIMEETMKRVPLMKSILDHYAGPDRVTAKQQLGELERVAETLPASTPASVKRFTDRAVLSLQSNPGWGFDKKCQFMDKLIMEVSQQYK